ncbi:MAG: hypothetical protein KC800_06665 [Candidatus Eremiobacteraeota bacterium]|nr:hypothetical protein [Candidatus Eremiobacteraeota bacterium]
MREKAIQILALPSEGLALFRRGLGLLCILDACLRLPSAVFWLTDLGVLPRSLYFRLFEDTLNWSVYSISGRPEFVVCLLLATAILGAVQVAGRSKRWIRVALWVLLLSVQNRNPGVTDAADHLLRLLLFWDMLLPETPAEPRDYLSPATVGLQLQLSVAAGALAWHVSERGWQQAAAWSLSERAFAIPWLWMAVKLFLLIVTVGIWVRPLRIVPLLCGVPVLFSWGAIWDPFLPLTLLVAGSVCYRSRRDFGAVVESGRGLAAGAVVAGILILGQFVPSLSEEARFSSGGLGLEQSWESSYPGEETAVVALLARRLVGGDVLWNLDFTSDRRSRMWAQKVGQDRQWASRLTDALQHRLELSEMPVVWMKKSSVQADQTLGPVELELLTDTPVWGETRGRVEL